MVSDSEMIVTEDIFHALDSRKYSTDFSDDGNKLFLTNKTTNECFTITVKQDE